jgi:hypothetical protein
MVSIKELDMKKRKLYNSLLILLGGLLFLPGCELAAYYAAEAIGIEQDRKIKIDSSPQGAKVTYDGVSQGTTPTYLTFVESNKTLGTHILKIKKDGYRTIIRKFIDKKNVGTSRDYPKSVFFNLEKEEPPIVKSHTPRLKTPPVTIQQEKIRPATPALPKPKHKFTSNVVGQKWAVVVGISKYKNTGNNQITNLRYAAKDAQSMADFLKSPQGGGFDNVYVMIDEDVTYKNMRYALFDYLGRALEEDMVLFFFAGHGAPDPDETKNLYLLTYDTDPNSVSSTAFPMWDVETALRRTIKAETVVMLTDACHSGGINPQIGTRGITVEDNPTNDAILKLAHSPGMVSITASEAREVSHESKKWGGGHGVFTHFLLEGLRGKADTDGNQKVCLGEMIDYTSEQVRRATRNKQHPDVSGSFDRQMPMAIVR